MEISEIKKILDYINILKDEKTILNTFLEYGMKLLNCESASFFTINENKKMITFNIVKGEHCEELEGISFEYKGIVGWCATNRKDVLVKDTSNNPVFTSKIDYATSYKTKSVIAIVIGYGNEIYGIVEFINPKEKESFDEKDFDLIKILSYFVSYVIYITRMENSIFEINKRFNSTINNLSGGFIGIDNNGIVMFFNPKAKEILGLEYNYVGRNINEFDVHLGKIKDLILDAKNGKLIKRGEILCNIKGVDKKIGFSTITLKSVDGSVLGGAIIFQDIT